MNQTIEKFYLKNAETNYIDQYDIDHGPRIDYVIKEFSLDSLHGKRVVDIGCGLGNYFKRLPPNNVFIGLDGASYPKGKKLCDFLSLKVDINSGFSSILDNEERFDLAICSEVLEHIPSVYTCVEEIKKLVVINGFIVITTPHPLMEHNYIYPGLFAHKENMEQFFQQMALEVVSYRLWDKGWQSYCWLLRNLPWESSRMMFPKNEGKFYGKTPLEYVNL
jgi:2-polyprenyl-3-methyl-5-hydroxy-6-metoxy-1,4-benzoquinol methylase